MRLLIDHNFDERVLRRLHLRIPDIEVLTARSVGLATTPDRALLAATVRLGCVLLTHDGSTVTPIVRDLMRAGAEVPRVVVFVTGASQATVVDDLEIVVRCGLDSDWLGGPIWIPF